MTEQNSCLKHVPNDEWDDMAKPIAKQLTMTVKEKAISVIQSLNDDVSLDDLIDRLYLLRKIEIGVAQATTGDVIEHDQFMAELEAEDAK